jgi:hypothetical protein
MPVNDAQYRAITIWVEDRNVDPKRPAVVRARWDFVWDNLTPQQRTGLTSRVKADLGAEFAARAIRRQDQAELEDDIVSTI